MSAANVPQEYRGHYKSIGEHHLVPLAELYFNADTAGCDPAHVNDPKYRLLHRLGVKDRQISELFAKEDFRSTYKWLFDAIPRQDVPALGKHRAFRVRKALGGMHETSVGVLLDHPTVLGAEALGSALQQLLGKHKLATLLELRDIAVHTYDPKLKITLHEPPYIPDAKSVRAALTALYKEHGKDSLRRALGENALADRINAGMTDKNDTIGASDVRNCLRGTGPINSQKALQIANGLLSIGHAGQPTFETIQQLEEAGRNLSVERKRE